MSDPFKQFSPTLTAPASALYEITPDDGADLGVAVRALNVAAAGAVRVTTVDDTVASVFVAAGTAFPVRVKRVWATGTTATGIVGLV